MSDGRFVVEVAVWISLWYTSSAVANTTSRKILTQAPLPLFLTCCQFVFASVFGFLILRVLKVREYKPIPAAAKENHRRLTLVYAVGFLFVNAGYVLVNVSLAETLRSAEPLVTVILAVLFLKSEPVSKMEMFSMLPIVIGGCLSSLGDSTFSFLALFSVTVSNLAFSLRSMFTKKLREQYDGDAFNVFFHISSLGTVYLVSILLLLEFVGSAFLPVSESIDSLEASHQSHKFFIFSSLEKLLTMDMLNYIFVNGVTYVTYNQASFYVLSRVRMVTHGVANAFRRIVTILFSVWYFGNEVNLVNAFGITLAVAGVVLYAKAKDSSAGLTTTLPFPSRGMLMKSGV